MLTSLQEQLIIRIDTTATIRSDLDMTGKQNLRRLQSRGLVEQRGWRLYTTAAGRALVAVLLRVDPLDKAI